MAGRRLSFLGWYGFRGKLLNVQGVKQIPSLKTNSSPLKPCWTPKRYFIWTNASLVSGRIHPRKLTWHWKICISIGNTSTHSWWIFQSSQFSGRVNRVKRFTETNLKTHTHTNWPPKRHSSRIQLEILQFPHGSWNMTPTQTMLGCPGKLVNG